MGGWEGRNGIRSFWRQILIRDRPGGLSYYSRPREFDFLVPQNAQAFVVGKPHVTGDDRYILGERLGDEHAIERVAVIFIKWQVREFVEMPELDGQERRPHFVDGGLYIGRAYAQLRFHDDLPAGYNADQAFGLSPGQRALNGSRKRTVGHPPKEGVGIEQQPHSEPASWSASNIFSILLSSSRESQPA